MLSSDLQKLSVAGLVTLYELDATKLGGDVFRWHGHMSHEEWQYIYGYTDKTKYTDASRKTTPTGQEDIIRRNIIWAGQEYTPVAIKTDGLEVRSDGQPSTPVMGMSNNIEGVNGAVTAMCAVYSDFVGSNLRVITLLAKHLDSSNFTEVNPSADPSQYNQQFWTIEQKTQETSMVVNFELANPLAAQRKRIPSRNITPYCHWAVCGDYRGESCGYTGAAMFTESGQPITNPALDKCGGRISDCKLRFGQHEPLSFGGFASSSIPR